MRLTLDCRGVGALPCLERQDGRPMRALDGVGRCAGCHRRHVRLLAIRDMRDLRDVADGKLVAGPCERQPEHRDEQEPQRHEDPDGTVWTDFDVDGFVDPALDDDAKARA